MPRAGLTPDVVTRAAAALLDRDGSSSLTLARIAEELGVKAPSLYNHVDGLDALTRRVALEGVDQLADACRAALMGRSGSDALREFAAAYRVFARAHPGVYALTQVARPGDTEYEARAQRLLEPVRAVLSGLGLPDADLVHAARAVRSALHGFALLEGGSGFGLDVDVDASFDWMIGTLVHGLAGAQASRAAVE